MYTCTIYTCTCTCIYMCMFMHECTCVYFYVHMHTHTCTHTELDPLSSAPPSPPIVQQFTSTATPPSKGRRSIARKQYNTESNRMVFTGVSLLGQMKVTQSGTYMYIQCTCRYIVYVHVHVLLPVAARGVQRVQLNPPFS